MEVERSPKVALIGCGPSGMFLMHALATKARNAIKKQDADALEALPLITCFEKMDCPGGVWVQRKDEETCSMYETMWSNRPKETTEFSDYTFVQHFGGDSVPTYLPAADLLDYMLKRTTSVDPQLFNSERRKFKRDRRSIVRFNSTVLKVVFLEDVQQFEVESLTDDEPRLERFDYCVWAAGKHSKPRIPKSILNVLKTGGIPPQNGESPVADDDAPAPFTGTILHSIHTPHFEDAIRGKRVVLIGDDGSAEDIALHACRLDVEQVYVLSRSGFGNCVYMGQWPSFLEEGEVESRVEVLKALPYRVVNNGTALLCNEFHYNQETERYDILDYEPPELLEEIDTVIFCTGYFPSMEFLSENLQFQRLDIDDMTWALPSDFKMRKNPLTEELGQVEPSSRLDISGNLIPGLYRTLKISNPRLMFLMDLNYQYSLLSLDVGAWLCLAYITGEAPIPSKTEMESDLREQMIEEMHIPHLRWCMDMNYFDAMDRLGETHWSDNCADPRSIEMDTLYCAYYARTLARDMREAKYPIDMGTYEKLNETGMKMVQINLHDIYARHDLEKFEEDYEWRTFRDVDPTPFCSFHTGQKSTPLPGKWIDLDKQEIVRFSKNRR